MKLSELVKLIFASTSVYIDTENRDNIYFGLAKNIPESIKNSFEVIEIQPGHFNLIIVVK